MPYPVHRLANIFPLLPRRRLETLAANIREKGLIDPITLGRWRDGRRTTEGILDGRNRELACEIAGVEARYVHYEGDDIAGFIVSRNISRRDLSKGQQAMAMAMIYPDG